MKDDRQPWLAGDSDEYCWCDGCIRDRNEEAQMSTDPAETTTTERLEHEAELTYEQVEALSDADFKAKVRAELRGLKRDHHLFTVELVRAEERVQRYNRLLETLREFAQDTLSDEAWDAYNFVGTKATAASEAVHEAESDVHHAAVAIEALERAGHSDYPRVRLAALEQDAPF